MEAGLGLRDTENMQSKCSWPTDRCLPIRYASQGYTQACLLGCIDVLFTCVARRYEVAVAVQFKVLVLVERLSKRTLESKTSVRREEQGSGGHTATVLSRSRRVTARHPHYCCCSSSTIVFRGHIHVRRRRTAKMLIFAPLVSCCVLTKQESENEQLVRDRENKNH